MKTPKTVMRLTFYPPDKLFCQDLPPKTNCFSSMVPSLSKISVANIIRGTGSDYYKLTSNIVHKLL